MLTTHDIVDIEKLCKRVIIIDKGQVIYDGSLSAIKQQYGRRRRVIFATTDGATPAGLETELAALGDGIRWRRATKARSSLASTRTASRSPH